VPNVFSPNDDYINDYVTVFSNDVNAIVLEFEIFDRWGEKVFRGTDFPVNVPELGWDGRFKGQYMNPAVFVYVAKVRFTNNTIRVISGDITLVR
jgi:gliding motility-associated-like protein